MKQTSDTRHPTPDRTLLVVLLSIVYCLTSNVYLSAQDIHFTQFFTNPLLLNPAQTGNFNGNYRMGFNFKGEWPWAIAGPAYTYQTEAAYVDFSFLENKLKTGWMGIGLNFMNDEAGDGILVYRKLGLSYAYHQAFDKEQRYVLSAGAVANYVYRAVDFSKLYFNDQWVNDMGFDLSLNPNEPIARTSFSMLDLGAGLGFSAQVSEQFKFTLGYSLLHLNEPRDNFYNDAERLGLRQQATAGIQYKFTERLSLNADVYYGYEKLAQEGLFGATVEYGFYNKRASAIDNSVYAGLYYRVGDAVAPLVGYQVKHLRMLLSYDITVSKLFVPSQANGGPEISLVYAGSWTKEFNGKKVYCPKF